MVNTNVQLSEKLSELYYDTNNICGSRNIIIEVNDSKVPSNYFGFQDVLPNGDFIIYSMNVPYMDAIISHELLHIYFIYKLYPVHNELADIDKTIREYGIVLHN